MRRPNSFRLAGALVAGVVLVIAAWQVYQRATGEPSLPVAGWKRLHPGESTIELVLTTPSRPNTVYVVTSPGGISTTFQSEDGGASWSGVADEQSAGLALQAVDPVHPQNLYGFGEFYDVVERPAGPAKSTDGGESWVAAIGGLPNPGLSIDVSSIVVDPVTPETLYAVVNGDVFKSTNGGVHWARVWRAPKDVAVDALAVDPRRPLIVYAGARTPGEEEFFDDVATVFKSTDGARSWQRTGLRNVPVGFTDTMGIAIDPQAPETLYLTADDFYESTDGGRRWRKLILPSAGLDSSALPLSSSTPAVLEHVVPTAALAVDPSRPHTVYVTAQSQAIAEEKETVVLKSTNGGKTWAVAARLKGKMNDPDVGEVEPRFVTLAVDPTGRRVYAGTDWSGLYLCDTCWKLTSPPAR